MRVKYKFDLPDNWDESYYEVFEVPNDISITDLKEGARLWSKQFINGTVELIGD